MSLKSWELKDRTYVLTNSKSPLTYTVQVRHTQRKPLMWFDEKQGINRPLRYATNQKSLFIDEQDGNATLEHIVFNDGMLHVPRTQPLMQQFLSYYHPQAGKLWQEINKEEEAKDDLAIFEQEYSAMALAHELGVDQLESILRSEYGSHVADLSTQELKRDAYIFARTQPELFIKLAHDEDIKYRSFANKIVETGHVKLTKDNTEFQHKNGRKIFTVPFDENPYSALARWFKTDEGSEIYLNLKKKI